MKRLAILLIPMLLAVAACESPPATAPGTEPDQPSPTIVRPKGEPAPDSPTTAGETISVCGQEAVINALGDCLDGVTVERVGEKLVTTFGKWNLSEENWSPRLLHTKAFRIRFGLSEVQTECLTRYFCKEFYP